MAALSPIQPRPPRPRLLLPSRTRWTSNGQTYTATAKAAVVAGGSAPEQTTWAYTAKPYTSTWTSNGQTFTAIATTTLVTTATIGTDSTATTLSSRGAAAAATGSFNIWRAGALVAGVAAII
ncbi:hypothetical protein MAC_05015 [Metarhizium acridum CQMa 102]|uniref:Uncharacterized protein n=1 Tax=Metarhizium acridum (strain CQMa 102) TaxID=655827 RepID=E9E546_METAQ|nr:uncharacterized protein MAC_05015 [Metarhizium acridum CQMa 102]EFY88921.1 hypothetical protein MAC_05015 [Metarhizium acridum CQMa 102]